MFRADSQDTLNAWTRGSLSLDRFLPAYQDNWNMPWPLYQDIFLYVREHEIPLIGLNISDGVARKGGTTGVRLSVGSGEEGAAAGHQLQGR